MVGGGDDANTTLERCIAVFSVYKSGRKEVFYLTTVYINRSHISWIYRSVLTVCSLY